MADLDEAPPPSEAADPNSEETTNAAPTPAPVDTSNLPAMVVHGAQRDDEQHAKLLKWITSTNIAEDLDESLLDAIGQKVCREYDLDDNSRSDWKEKSKKSMDLAMQVAEAKTYPWPRSSNVIYPLMTTAAVQFAARAYPAIVMGRNVVRGVAWGDDSGQMAPNPQQPGQPLINPQTGQPVFVVPPGARRMRADKIGEHMSWQLLDEQTEWEEETDKLLHILPILGCAFRKSYFDSAKGRNASVLVSAMKVVINYGAKSLETAPRLTEELSLYPLEVTEMELSKVFLPIEYGAEPNSNVDDDAPREFLEQHRWLDLDEDEYPEPYVVTVHKASSKVVRIVARYDHDGVKFNRDGDVVKIDPIHYYTKYDFFPNPDGGIYGVGFGQLLRPVNEAVNTTLNMMIDAGHLQVVGGGFIGKQLSMHTGNVRFIPGEYKAVNAPGVTIKENIVPLETPGPNTVLFQLLGMLVEAGKEISATKDILSGDIAQANVPATTTLAMIEQGLKSFTAIYKRVHRSLKKELAKLYRLNSIYLSDTAGYQINNEWKTISRQDYVKGNGVEPVSDPSMVSDMQKLGRAQFLLGFANDPLFNGMAIRKRVLDAANIEKPEELLVTQPPPNPEIIEKQAKLSIQHERMKAESTKDYAQAYLFMHQAAKLVDEAHVDFVTNQLKAFEVQMEALANARETDGSQGGGAG